MVFNVQIALLFRSKVMVQLKPLLCPTWVFDKALKFSALRTLLGVRMSLIAAQLNLLYIYPVLFKLTATRTTSGQGGLDDPKTDN